MAGVMALSLTLFSCGSKDDDPQGSEIVGTWVSEKIQFQVHRAGKIVMDREENTEDFVLRFDPDMTGEFVSEQEPFTYVVTAKSTLTLTFTDTNGEETPELLLINSWAGNTMVLMYEQLTQVEGEQIQELQYITLHKQ